jgi:hypothetical protein
VVSLDAFVILEVSFGYKFQEKFVERFSEFNVVPEPFVVLVGKNRREKSKEYQEH